MFGSGFDDLGPTIGPIKGLVTRSMLKKIHEKRDLQEAIDIHGLQMLFSWAKEDVKIL